MKRYNTKKNNSIFENKLFQYTIILFFTFLLYGNTIFNDYSFDDDYVTNNNAKVSKGFKGIVEILTSRYEETTEDIYGYRPITQITFAIEKEIFGNNPSISHFINVLLYFFCSILLYKFLRNICYFNTKLLFLSVLLFMAHPVHTEVVASLKNREELLCTIFGISSSYSFFKYLDFQKIRFIIYSIILMSLAYLSKETSVIFIPVIIIFVFFFRDKPEFLKIWAYNYKWLIAIALILLLFASKLFINGNKNIIFFSLLAAGITILTYTIKKIKNTNKQLFDKNLKTFVIGLSFLILAIVISQVLPDLLLPSKKFTFYKYENPLMYGSTFKDDLLIFLCSIGYYIKLLFVPYPLGFYYGYNFFWWAKITHPLIIIFSLSLLLSLLYSLYHLEKNNIIVFFILLLLFSLLPISNLLIKINGIVAERLLFIPSISFALFITFSLFISLKEIHKRNINSEIQIKFTKSKIIIYLTILFTYTFLTINRNKDWKNVLTLYEADIEFLSESVKANNNYAGYLMNELLKEQSIYGKISDKNKSKVNKVIKHFEKVIQLDPNYKSALNNLGAIYFYFLNDYHKSLYYFHKLNKIDTSNAIIYNNIAICYEKLGKTDSLIFYLKKYANKTNDFQIHIKISDLLFATGMVKEAIKHNEEFAKAFPNSDIPYLNIAGYYQMKNNKDSAIIYLEKALKIKQENKKAIKDARDYYISKNNHLKAKYYDSLLNSIQK